MKNRRPVRAAGSVDKGSAVREPEAEDAACADVRLLLLGDARCLASLRRIAAEVFLHAEDLVKVLCAEHLCGLLSPARWVRSGREIIRRGVTHGDGRRWATAIDECRVRATSLDARRDQLFGGSESLCSTAHRAAWVRDA